MPSGTFPDEQWAGQNSASAIATSSAVTIRPPAIPIATTYRRIPFMIIPKVVLADTLLRGKIACTYGLTAVAALRRDPCRGTLLGQVMSPDPNGTSARRTAASDTGTRYRTGCWSSCQMWLHSHVIDEIKAVLNNAARSKQR
jgi:hypothetical protein